MSYPSLFKPLKVGNLQLKHRLVMAPMTRFRAEDDHIPLPAVFDYYTQRASVPGTLLISEGALIHPVSGGFPNIPGLWNSAQIAAWKRITDSVHAKGSYIILQIAGLGRAAYPDVLEAEASINGETKLHGPSAIPIDGQSTPAAMTEEQIWDYVEYFKQAAKNSVEAGFDGVEVHGANGYLVDEFIQDTANQRTDAWGGSVEKRARFPLEIVKTMADAIGPERIGFRVSPYSKYQNMGMEDPKPTFLYLIQELKKLNIAYLHSTGPGADDADPSTTIALQWLVEAWGKTKPIFLCGGYNAEKADSALISEYKDYDNIAFALGRQYLSNPDLAFRVQHGIELTPWEKKTFYDMKSLKGYADYDFSKEFSATLADA